jgi:hypothetical protein
LTGYLYDKNNLLTHKVDLGPCRLGPPGLLKWQKKYFIQVLSQGEPGVWVRYREKEVHEVR